MLSASQVRVHRDSRCADAARLAIELMAAESGLNLVQAMLQAVNHMFGCNWGEMQWAAIERMILVNREFDA